jgi:hypothetical protein
MSDYPYVKTLDCISILRKALTATYILIDRRQISEDLINEICDVLEKTSNDMMKILENKKDEKNS